MPGANLHPLLGLAFNDHKQRRDLSVCAAEAPCSIDIHLFNNVLNYVTMYHVTVGMTKKLLDWNKDLIKHGDRSSGSTPLHFAASWDIKKRAGLQSDISRRAQPLLDASPLHFAASLDMSDISRRAELLLDAYESSAYQPDKTGSFPIHVAALGNNLAVVHVLLEKCPGCAQLRDAQGRTLLHIAVSKDYCRLVGHIINHLLGKGVCEMQRFASILNMQDKEGNSALHFAAANGGPGTMRRLIWREEVQLNLQNNQGRTPLDLAHSRTPPGVFFGLVCNIIFDLRKINLFIIFRYACMCMCLYILCFGIKKKFFIYLFYRIQIIGCTRC